MIVEVVPDESFLSSDGEFSALPFHMVRTVASDASWNAIGEGIEWSLRVADCLR